MVTKILFCNKKGSVRFKKWVRCNVTPLAQIYRTITKALA